MQNIVLLFPAMLFRALFQTMAATALSAMYTPCWGIVALSGADAAGRGLLRAVCPRRSSKTSGRWGLARRGAHPAGHGCRALLARAFRLRRPHTTRTIVIEGSGMQNAAQKPSLSPPRR